MHTLFCTVKASYSYLRNKSYTELFRVLYDNVLLPNISLRNQFIFKWRLSTKQILEYAKIRKYLFVIMCKLPHMHLLPE